MKVFLLKKLDVFSDCYEELMVLFGDVEVISDQICFCVYFCEYVEVELVILVFCDYCKVQVDFEGVQVLFKDSDLELCDFVEEEVVEVCGCFVVFGDSLQCMLLLKDFNDSCNVFLEICVGIGGDEVVIFFGDLFCMYLCYVECQGWWVEMLLENEGEYGGYKEVIVWVEGDNVYVKFKFEFGVYCVQWVLEIEFQGWIYIFVCIVVVLLELDEQVVIEINLVDLWVDIYCFFGVGGQYVNKIDLVVCIIYIFSGIVVECQEECLQYKNCVKVMVWLVVKFNDQQQVVVQQVIVSMCKLLVGLGDCLECICIYNFL